MYLVDKQLKKLTPVPTVTFAEQGLKERQDLQEWLAAYPEALGEKLLIIQKEFAGFDGTAERLAAHYPGFGPATLRAQAAVFGQQSAVAVATVLPAAVGMHEQARGGRTG